MAAQIAQSRAWYDQQSAELAAKRAAEKREVAALGTQLRLYDQIQMDIKAQEDEMRSTLNRATQDTNRRLAQDKAMRTLRQREAELAANISEMTATLNSAVMTEDPMQATSALSPTRVRVDHWKGFSPSQRADVLNGQLAQVAANQAARHTARLEEIAFAKNQQDVLKAFSEQVRAAKTVAALSASRLQSLEL